MNLKSSSAKDWKRGDKGITRDGQIVTVADIVGERYIKIKEDLDKKIYIPAHGEIERI